MTVSGVHTILYSRDVDAARGFFRDVLGLDSVDSGGGWLIFALPPAELAFHPTDGTARAELFLMCQDLDATREQLRQKGVRFAGPVSEESWGRLAHMEVPGFGPLGLYEPHHPSPLEQFR
jgi:catechol 2,3-dioxygenase-like lactoylglutathione lyase family enzyme